jgi:pRiA4b ORF-3-like protein
MCPAGGHHQVPPRCYSGYGPYTTAVTIAEVESGVRLWDVSAAAAKKLRYEYDVGASWRHEVPLERTAECDPSITYPLCTGFSQPDLSQTEWLADLGQLGAADGGEHLFAHLLAPGHALGAVPSRVSRAGLGLDVVPVRGLDHDCSSAWAHRVRTSVAVSTAQQSRYLELERERLVGGKRLTGAHDLGRGVMTVDQPVKV